MTQTIYLLSLGGLVFLTLSTLVLAVCEYGFSGKLQESKVIFIVCALGWFGVALVEFSR